MDKLHRVDRARPTKPALDDDEPLEEPGRRTLTMRLRRAPPGTRPALAPGAAWRSTVPEVAPEVALALGLVPFEPSWTGPILRDADGPAPAALDPAVIERARAGPSSPLPDELRRRLERALGADLGEVRLHVDGAAAAAAAAVAARAFTLGQDVFFAAGAYDPSSEQGFHLIAHEIAHTLQAGAAGAPREGIDVSAPGDALERDADAVAACVVAADRAADRAAPAARVARPAPVTAPAGPPRIHRTPDGQATEGAAREGAAPDGRATEGAAADDAAAGGAWTDASIRQLVERSTPAQVLEQVAARDTENGLARLFGTGLWDQILSRHLRGGAIRQATRRAMFSFVERRLLDEHRYAQLFHVRFDLRFERLYHQPDANQARDTSRGPAPWNQLVGERIWWQLDRLPPQDVSENTALRTVRTVTRASASGFYLQDQTQPENEREVMVIREDGVRNTGEGGQTDDEAQVRHELHLEEVVRHEIGHAVHARLGSTITPWLEGTVRFTQEAATPETVAALLQRIAPFPAETSAEQRARFVQIILQWILGQGQLPLATDQTEDARVMAAFPGEHLALRFGHADGRDIARYPRTSRGREFPNLRYHNLNAMGPVALEMVSATGRNQAGYAPAEFVAECYAEYYMDPRAASEPARRGGRLPPAIKTWFDQHVAPQGPPQRPRGEAPAGGGAGGGA